MKLLVIGHSVEDLIIYKNTEQRKPGGLFYTATGLYNIKDENDEILICTSTAENNYHLFEPVYSKLNPVHSIRQKDGIPRVRLTIYDDRERDEKYDFIGGNLKFDLEKINEPDGILINMVTGFDITLEQLKEIRKKFRCPIYMDVHTLSRGVTEDLKRPQRIIPDFSEWAGNLDIVQVNENELFSLYQLDSEMAVVEKVLTAGVKYLIVTKADKGARIYYKKGTEILSVFQASLKVIVKNKVGCGDIFGAVFFYIFIKFGDAIKSLRMANTAAGMISSYENLEQFRDLKKDVFTRYN